MISKLSLIAAAVLAVALVACSSESEEPAPAQPAPTTPPAPAQPAPTTPPAPSQPAPAPSGPKQWDSPPAMEIDTSKKYTAVFELAKGEEFEIELFADKAPNTVNNFVFPGSARFLRRRDVPPRHTRVHGPGRGPYRQRHGRTRLSLRERVSPGPAP